MSPRTTRRDFIRTAFASLIPLSIGCSFKQKRKPNILLIMADDLGYGDIGCYGSETIKTPHLDALAKGGLLFTDYYANAPVCSPTRAALLTGRYQQRSGLEGVIYVRGETRQTGMDPSEITFANVLKSDGYATGLFGKWHLGYQKKYNPVHQGFDEFKGYVSGNIDYHSHYDNAGIFDWWHNLEQVKEEGYCTDLITGHTIAFIEKHQDQPFCAYVPYETPHCPYQGPNDEPERFPDTNFTYEGKRPDQKNAYKEMIESMDAGIGRIVKTVRDLGLEKETFIFFCSDNGAVNKVGSNGGLRGQKTTLWEGGIRVPAIAYWPGTIPANQKTDVPVMTMDLFPTILTTTRSHQEGIPPLDGIDFTPLWTQTGFDPQRALFWRYRHQKAVRQGNWKLVIDRDKPHLFDLTKDPREAQDLIDQHPGVAADLHEKLDTWETGVLYRVELKTT